MTTLLPLAIDKIAITVPLPDEDSDSISWYLNVSASDRDLGLRRLSNYTYNARYNTGCHLLLNEATNAHCKILAHPRGAVSSYMRLEWNPSNSGDEGFQRIREFIEHLREPGHIILLSDARITSLDLCVDIEGVHPDDLLINVSRMRVSKIYFSAQGETETMYIGDWEEGRRFFVIYDKTAELRRRTGQRIDQMTRIEVRNRPRNLTARTLHSISNPNPFGLINIQEWQSFDEATIQNRSKQLFLDGCRWRNATATLQRYESQQRGNLRQWLDEIGRAEWWNPGEIWQEWPALATGLRRFFGVRPRRGRVIAQL